MSNYAQTTAMPTIAPMLDTTKGSFGNRIDCAIDNNKNNATAYLKAAGVLGTITAGGYAAAKNPSAFNKIANFVGQQVAKLAAKIPGATKALPATTTQIVKTGTKITKGANFTALGKLQNIAKNVLTKIAKNPKAAIGIAVATITAGALSNISQNHAYKAGQIDQKYTDRANAQKA